MISTSQFNKRTYDWVTIALFVGLVVIGWLMLYAAVYEKDVDPQIFSLNSTVGSQTIWIIISFVAFWLVSNIEWKLWNTFAYPLYGIAIALLILVLIVGVEIKGARSWFRLGAFSFQPAEFAKLATTLALASYLSYYKCDLRKRRPQLISLALIIVPILLTLLQPDAGSALIFTSFGILLYREGMSPVYYYVAFALALTFIFTLMFNPYVVIPLLIVVILVIYIIQLNKKQTPLILFLLLIAFHIIAWWKLPAYEIKYLNLIIIGIDLFALLVGSYIMWGKRLRQTVTILLPSLVILSIISFGTNYMFNNILKPHQRDRINVWLKPQECDPRGSLYNIRQSKTAIGSGGFTGKGYLKGTMTELNHVPEQTTDFIFSIIGEEQGFVGVLTIILLYSLLIYRIILIGERARNLFIRRYAYGLAGILFMHFFINIGMTMGICPVVGIPLPFLSKGGTALLFFSIMLGILIKMDYSRLKDNM